MRWRRCTNIAHSFDICILFVNYTVKFFTSIELVNVTLDGASRYNSVILIYVVKLYLALILYYLYIQVNAWAICMLCFIEKSGTISQEPAKKIDGTCYLHTHNTFPPTSRIGLGWVIFFQGRRCRGRGGAFSPPKHLLKHA